MFIVLGMFLFLIILLILSESQPDYVIKPVVYKNWWDQYKSSYYLISDEDKILLSYYTEEEFTNVCMWHLINCCGRQSLCDTVKAFKTYINTGKWK